MNKHDPKKTKNRRRLPPLNLDLEPTTFDDRFAEYAELARLKAEADAAALKSGAPPVETPPSETPPPLAAEVPNQIAASKSGNKVATAATRPPSKVGTNYVQSMNKLGTKYEQSRDKVGSQPGTKYEQSRDKVGTKYEQNTDGLWYKVGTNQGQSRDKVLSLPGTEVGTNQGQSRDKPGTNPQYGTLYGKQKELVNFIFDLCQHAGSKISPPLQLNHLADALKCSLDAARTTRKRVEEKGFFARNNYKNGRGGWSTYRINDQVYNQIHSIRAAQKVGTKYEQSRDKVLSLPGSQPGTSPSSSSSININNTTTPSEPFDFSSVDFSGLERHKINAELLTQQMDRVGNTPEELIDLVYRFKKLMSDPKEASKIKSPVGMFCAFTQEIKKGLKPLAKYRTEDEEMIARLADESRQAKEHEEQKEKQFQDDEFEQWLDGLYVEQKVSMVPENSQAPAGSSFHNLLLKDYFNENIWPAHRAQLLKAKKSQSDD